MADIILILILLIIIGAAVRYIIKARKSGVKCIGCPSGCSCSHEQESHCSGGCDCHMDTK
ncbi:MAG: FeoB-associated Cys-rich membrane protein [Lachnospiraceae bacterium]|nr:FeoB-associated Cys-rich membrane protein [Lachnospiraceae bacterium]